MANNYANRQTIPLNAFINLSKDKTQVENFNKFNCKNGTIYGGNLASFYTKEETNDAGSAKKIVYDSAGNSYSLKDGKFYKNDTVITSIGATSGVTKSQNNRNYLAAYYEQRFYVKNKDLSTLYYENLSTADEATINLDSSPYKCIAVKPIHYSLNSWGIFYLLEYYTGKTIYLSYKYFNNGVEQFNKYKQIANTNIDYSDILLQGGKIKIDNTNYYGLTVYFNAGENVKDVNSLSFIIENPTNSGTCTIYDLNSWNNAKPVTATVEKNKIGFINKNDEEIELFNFQNYANIDKTKGIAYIAKIDTYGITGISWDNANGIINITYNEGYEDTQPISAIISGYTILDGFYLQTIYYKTASGKAQFLQWANRDNRQMVQALFNVDDLDNPTTISDGKTYIQWLGTGTTYYKMIRHGEIIGIACYTSTELIEFLTIDKTYPVLADLTIRDEIIYTDINSKGNIIKIRQPAEIIGIYEDNFILINSTSQKNAYDISQGKFYNFCTSATSMIKYGIDFDVNVLDDTETRLLANISLHTEFTLENATDYKKYVCAISNNNMYEVSNVPFMGIQFEPFFYYKIDYGSKNNYSIISMSKDYGEVDFYESLASESIYPYYKNTFIGLKRILNDLLTGLTYTVNEDIIMPPSLTSKFITSYLNRNYVINDNKGYPLIQWNNTFYFGYTSLSFIENIKAVFVIQTMTYFITDRKLIYAQYSGNELVQSQIVADITGLLYLGSLYDRALFFSQYNRKIYQFTGDSILTEFLECNNIKDISAVSYIPMSNSVIFAATENDDKQVVFIMQQGNMVRLEDVSFNRIYTTENDNDSIILVSDDKIVYLNNEQYSGFTKEKLKVETCYFGIGQEQKSIFSCYYVRIYSENKLNGQIKVKTYTLTDTEEKTTEKIINVKFDDWTENGTTLFKFQPALQEATATKLYIESDFDIQNIYAEFTSSGTQTDVKSRLQA